MIVSELIALLSKLPPDMELRKLNSRDDYKVEGSRDMGFKVVNGRLYHIYDVATDPDGTYLEEFVPAPTAPEDIPFEYGTPVEEPPKAKRKRGADAGA